ncbi:MAG TPA: FtsX-like permease family protein [Candidatus Bathyarchaeia archaeon]
MFSYAVKRVIRSSGLFAALLLGVVLASTFFAGINIGADTTAKATLNQQLSQVLADVIISQYSWQPSSTWANAVQKVKNVNGVTGAEVISRGHYQTSTTFGSSTYYFTIAGISNGSRVREGLTVTSGSSSLGTNETYVWIGSKNAEEIVLNDTIPLDFTVYSRDDQTIEVHCSLKVVGFVELNDNAYGLATGYFFSSIQYQSLREQYGYGDNLLIVSWEETFARILDAVPVYNAPFATQILAYLNLDALINPWDILASTEAIRTITAQVNQAVAEYTMTAYNNLEQTLMNYQSTSMLMRFTFFIVALPVFFVAWYVGTTVSSVSYNLRRREIGLLLTKGVSSGQLFRMFLTESIIIGVVGSLIGIGLGFVLGPFFATPVGGELGVAPALNQEVVIMTIIFGLAITLLSTFRPSRKAASLPAVDALREYVYTEEVKPYKQKLPWLAFILGTYKIIMFFLGINLFQMFFGRPLPFTNIVLMILFGLWLMIDSALNVIGPLLFFWGFTKIFILGSLKFQQLVTRTLRFLGDLGTLATKNVRRNPARAASVAFLLALIVGYSFQTVGALASQQDYDLRRIKNDVGADISVQPASTANALGVANAIGNLSGVASTTIEYSLSGTLPSQYANLPIRMVDPDKWLSTAYYEDGWFSGNDATTAFQQMKTSNETVILDKNVAKILEKGVGDNITLNIGGSMLQLRIVGLFGVDVVQQQYYVQKDQYIGGAFWSYMPVGLFNSVEGTIYPQAEVLVKLEPSSSGADIASEIRTLANVSYVRSVAENLATYQSNLLLVGSSNVQRIGVVFSILAASVGTSLATLVSLQERKREASIMNVRGLSFKQLVTVFLAENLPVVVFSVVLGVVVGLIWVSGNISASNANLSYLLVTYRMTFPLDSIILLSTCLILVFASSIIPVILMTKRYISKVERIVRL